MPASMPTSRPPLPIVAGQALAALGARLNAMSWARLVALAAGVAAAVAAI